MTDAYQQFLERKRVQAVATGFDVSLDQINPRLFGFQKALVRWACIRGRAAILADTGLGKGWMILEWCRLVAEKTGLPVLILAPLAVAEQFQREAVKLGAAVTLCKSQNDVRPGVNVTNYQKIHKFDLSEFGGIALDEASILKSIDGRTRQVLVAAARDIPYRLAASATPAPNDHTEYGGQAEFLGIMTHAEMLSTFFVHDSGSTQDWRLKGHAREAFWRWIASWGAIVKLPSDLGFPDDGYILPPLCYHEHIIPATEESISALGLLFAKPADTLLDQRAARRETLEDRVRLAADIANAASGQCIVWCDLVVESTALTKAIDGAVEVCGSQTDEEKEESLERFISGRCRVLVSKSSLCGWGLNLQFARTVIFCGVTHSFEAWFQAIRRVWRFGVEGDVNVHIISSELEGRVVENLKRKAAEAESTARETQVYVSEFVRGSVLSAERQLLDYRPTVSIRWPQWLRTESAA